MGKVIFLLCCLLCFRAYPGLCAVGSINCPDQPVYKTGDNVKMLFTATSTATTTINYQSYEVQFSRHNVSSVPDFVSFDFDIVQDGTAFVAYNSNDNSTLQITNLSCVKNVNSNHNMIYALAGLACGCIFWLAVIRGWL